jgi:hypothetical protein
MRRRPAAPAADFEARAACETQHRIIRNRCLVAVDEADCRIALVDVPIVGHFAAQVRPGILHRRSDDQVREGAVRQDDREARGDAIATRNGQYILPHAPNFSISQPAISRQTSQPYSSPHPEHQPGLVFVRQRGNRQSREQWRPMFLDVIESDKNIKKVVTMGYAAVQRGIFPVIRPELFVT